MRNSTIQDYQLTTIISSSKFTFVQRAIHLPTKKEVAIKILPKKYCEDLSMIPLFRTESEIAKTLDHPFISQVFELIETDDAIYLVMELASHENLLNFVNKQHGIGEVRARKIFIQLVSALIYLHRTKKIAHRDLKAENILLDKNYNIRVVDFGFSKLHDSVLQNMSTLCGSPGYIAPEILLNQPYGFEIDVWAIGIILFSIASGYLPFDDPNLVNQMNLILNSEPPYPLQFSDEFVELLGLLLEKDPANRIKLEDIIEHKWLKGMYPFQTKRNLEYYQTLTHELDQEIINQIEILGIPISSIQDDIQNNKNTVSAISYKIMRREKITEQLISLHAPKKKKFLQREDHLKTIMKAIFQGCFLQV